MIVGLLLLLAVPIVARTGVVTEAGVDRAQELSRSGPDSDGIPVVP